MDTGAIQIGQVSKQSGVSVDTVRYYEKIGLIHSITRTSGGFRLFRPHAVDLIKFVKQAQEFGFSLDEIKGLVGAGGEEECIQVRDLLQQKIIEVDSQIKKMRSFKKTLQSHLMACNEELSRKGEEAHCPVFFEIKKGEK
ncbi:MAG: heavy metal-responsive transcriptional regulator [Pyrinomonadaceae bacterium]|nr:heavy metal-responsive transcriptional regulator [Pyrinomonadaceae bacterium]